MVLGPTIDSTHDEPDEAVTFAERIRERVERYVADWPMTASIGIATLDGDDARGRVDVHTLLRDSDAAMYEAKRRGKNAVVAVQTNGAEEAAPFSLN